jgi:hypothetical protein
LWFPSEYIRHWPMSDISHKFNNFSLKSVDRLVRWSSLLILSPKSPGFKPQTGQKEEQKNQSSTRRLEFRTKFFILLIRNQQPKHQTGILRVILSDRNFGFYFGFYKIQNLTRNFGWAETGEIFDISGENECERKITRRYSRTILRTFTPEKKREDWLDFAMQLCSKKYLSAKSFENVHSVIRNIFPSTFPRDTLLILLIPIGAQNNFNVSHPGNANQLHNIPNTSN